MLEILGHEVRVAHDGLEALELAGGYHSEVVVLDIGMPHLDGYETCRRIRQEPWGREALLVAATGWGQTSDLARSSAAGFDAHLVKPVELDALEQLLLRRPRQTRAPAADPQPES